MTRKVKATPLPWFPCYPSKWLGAIAGMKPHQSLVYWVVCLRIYEDGKPCPDTEDALVRRTGLSMMMVRDALTRCQNEGKLVHTDAGWSNPKAVEILTEMKTAHKDRSDAGKTGARNRWQKDQQNQRKRNGKRIATPKQADAHLHLQGHTEPNGSVESPPPPSGVDEWPSDYLEIFWTMYPIERRQAKRHVAEKLARFRRDGVVTWNRLMAGLERYNATNPGSFACAPIVWLNGGRWDDENAISQNGATLNGQHRPRSQGLGFSGIAARIRASHGVAAQDVPLGESAAFDHSPHRN